MTLIAIGGAVLLAAATLAYSLDSFDSSIGGEFLRRDVEARLSDLLQGAVHVNEVQITFDRGIGLRGQGVTVYPSPTGAGLYAETVVAELNEAALLIGEVRLATLALEGLQVRLSLGPDGAWTK